MADLSVEVNVTSPSSIDVPLVRGDRLRTSSIYRSTFEVALALFSAGGGAAFAGEKLGAFGTGYLLVTGIAAGVFMVLAYRSKKKAVLETEE